MQLPFKMIGILVWVVMLPLVVFITIFGAKDIYDWFLEIEDQMSQIWEFFVEWE